jgi:uncharacterized membrane protein
LARLILRLTILDAILTFAIQITLAVVTAQDAPKQKMTIIVILSLFLGLTAAYLCLAVVGIQSANKQPCCCCKALFAFNTLLWTSLVVIILSTALSVALLLNNPDSIDPHVELANLVISVIFILIRLLNGILTTRLLRFLNHPEQLDRELEAAKTAQATKAIKSDYDHIGQPMLFSNL